MYFLCVSIYYRSNANAFSESVISLDVVVEFFHSLSSQCGAVVGFIYIQQHCKGGEVNQNVMGLTHAEREILMKKMQQFYISTPWVPFATTFL